MDKSRLYDPSLPFKIHTTLSQSGRKNPKMFLMGFEHAISHLGIRDVNYYTTAAAPQARYNSGEKTKIFAPKLDTYNYAYSGQFIYLEPGHLNQSQSLQMTEFHTMEGGPERGIVVMKPVTSGSPGWMLEVSTDVKGFEGMLLFQTTIDPPRWASALVERCISTRPIHIHNRRHVAPFPNNFVAMLPHSGHALPVICRPQRDLICLIACPFVINGDLHSIELNLSRIYSNGASQRIVPLTRTSLFGDARWTAKYMAEARFLLNVSDDAEPGIYQCSVSLGDTITHSLVELTIV